MRNNSFIDSLPFKSGIIATLAIMVLGGCIGTTYPYMKTETAQRIASPAWMIKRDIAANQFLLRAYERIHNHGGTAHIYIEGLNANTGADATPKNPVALHLASKDKAENVIYIALPCQYTGMVSPAEECKSSYWKEARFSNIIIEAFNAALDDISLRYDIHSFDLIGYADGGAISTILAAQRNDITSLRTVAGILDNETYTHHKQIPPLRDSLTPSSHAKILHEVPQYHFIGGRDSEVPPAILHSFLKSMPPSTCVQTMLIQEAEHDKGWVDKWPELLELPVTCYAKNRSAKTISASDTDTTNTNPSATSPQATNIHHYTTREKPMKP